jgi:hypothetical protein
MRRLLGIAAAVAAALAAGCAPPPLWPLKNDIGGRCPYYKDVPRFDVVYTYGSGPDRTVVRLGWLGAIVERAGSRGRGVSMTRARCFDHDTLAELYGHTARVLPRIEDTFAPHGAAILDAGWSETIEFTDEGKVRSTAWLSQGREKMELPKPLHELLVYYGNFVRTLTSPAGSPPLDPSAGRRGMAPSEPGTAAELERGAPPSPSPPAPGP